MFNPSVPPPGFKGLSGLVLSGGGARGAYEVGVFRYLFGDFAKRHGAPRFDIISGTSVGAINGAFLASIADDVCGHVPRMAALWSNLKLDEVLGFGWAQAMSMPKLFRGGGAAVGLLDTKQLITQVSENIRWTNITRNIRRGVLHALTVSATHIASGRPWVFADLSPQLSQGSLQPPGVVVRPAHITAAHVLASASIPFLFPPVDIRGELFVDGGLRLNTPISPAIQLGARRIFVIGLSSVNNPERVQKASLTVPNVFPGVPFLLGKVLNAFLLDRVYADLLELERVNRMLDDGARVYGPDFETRMNEHAVSQGRPSRHRVHTFSVHPSEDIGEIASAYLKKHGIRFGRFLGRGLLKMLDVGNGVDADLVSYLMFDGRFAADLMALGESDARRKEEQLAKFFAEQMPVG